MDNEAKQESDQLLLNAIRQKFVSRHEGGDNNRSFGSAQLSIPALKTPQTVAASASSTNVLEVSQEDLEQREKISSPLNRFLLNQLRQNKINGLSDGFKLPELKVPALGGDNNLNIPLLNRLANSNSIATSPLVENIEKGVKNLKINATVTQLTPTIGITKNSTTTSKTSLKPIDLSTALIVNHDNSANPRPAASTVLQTPKSGFIDCGLLNNSANTSSTLLDEFCNLSVRDVEYNHRLAEPSEFGLKFCADDKCSNKRCFPCAATSLDKLHLKIYKHVNYALNIKRFRFDKKSPDDLVKESLSKYQRTSHT